MSAVREFCAMNPLLAFVVVFAIAAISFVFIYCACYAICFTSRHRTLRKIGYPPAHCDADGDFPKTPKSNLL